MFLTQAFFGCKLFYIDPILHSYQCHYQYMCPSIFCMRVCKSNGQICYFPLETSEICKQIRLLLLGHLTGSVTTKRHFIVSVHFGLSHLPVYYGIYVHRYPFVLFIRIILTMQRQTLQYNYGYTEISFADIYFIHLFHLFHSHPDLE